MAVSLKKGQGVSLKKSEYDLSSVTIGLGWDINEEKPGGFFGLFAGKTEEYDLDVIAFLVGENGRVNDLGQFQDGRMTLVNSDIVFFNNLNHPSGKIRLTGDNRTGAGDGDDEQMIVNLNGLPARYARILFVVQIYEGKKRNQSFGKVKNAFIRAEDAKGKEMVRFDLSGGAGYSNCCLLTFAELAREGADNWKFNAIGMPHDADSFVHVLKDFLPS